MMDPNCRVYGKELVEEALREKVSRFKISEKRRHLFATPAEISKWIKELRNREITPRQVRNCLPAIIGEEINGKAIEYSIGGYRLIFRDDPPDGNVPAASFDALPFDPTRTQTQEEETRKGDEKHHSGGGGLLVPFAVGAGLAGMGLVVWRLHRWYSSR